jgi:hypothetical protein
MNESPRYRLERAAREKLIVRAGLHYVCDITIEAKINQLIYDGLWEEAIQYYNHYNAVKELILMREGCPVYKGGQ